MVRGSLTLANISLSSESVMSDSPSPMTETELEEMERHVTERNWPSCAAAYNVVGRDLRRAIAEIRRLRAELEWLKKVQEPVTNAQHFQHLGMIIDALEMDE